MSESVHASVCVWGCGGEIPPESFCLTVLKLLL